MKYVEFSTHLLTVLIIGVNVIYEIEHNMNDVLSLYTSYISM